MSIYKLPSKFTGYGSEKIEFLAFKSFCYTLQNQSIFKVTDINGYEYPKNFYQCNATDSEGNFTIYLNCYQKHKRSKAPFL